MRLHIEHMKSLQCKSIVKEELKKLGLRYTIIGIGLVELYGNVTREQLDKLKINLHHSGLELQNNRKNILIERIKDLINEMINYSEELPTTNYSDYISKKLDYDYTYLSNVFSSVKGMTIQQFIIINKIEKVKKLLLNDDLNVSEISYKLHYSSVSHLSNQFKKITGLSPSFYKHTFQKQSLRPESSFA